MQFARFNTDHKIVYAFACFHRKWNRALWCMKKEKSFSVSCFYRNSICKRKNQKMFSTKLSEMRVLVFPLWKLYILKLSNAKHHSESYPIEKSSQISVSNGNRGPIRTRLRHNPFALIVNSFSNGYRITSSLQYWEVNFAAHAQWIHA